MRREGLNLKADKKCTPPVAGPRDPGFTGNAGEGEGTERREPTALNLEEHPQQLRRARSLHLPPVQSDFLSWNEKLRQRNAD